MNDIHNGIEWNFKLRINLSCARHMWAGDTYHFPYTIAFRLSSNAFHHQFDFQTQNKTKQNTTHASQESHVVLMRFFFMVFFFFCLDSWILLTIEEPIIYSSLFFFNFYLPIFRFSFHFFFFHSFFARIQCHVSLEIKQKTKKKNN